MAGQRKTVYNTGLQKWRFSAPQTHLWLIKHWFSASPFVVKIATFAKLENVVPYKTIERSFSTEHFGCVVKVFIADFGQAETILNSHSLKENPPIRAIAKKLLLNMDDLGIPIDNIEGVTFGPDLPNGHKTLILYATIILGKVRKLNFCSSK